MSPSSDKVAAPTNGHRRALTDSDVAEDRATPDDGSAIGRLVPVGPGRDAGTSGVSPTQLAVGFGILTALIVVLLGRRRRD